MARKPLRSGDQVGGYTVVRALGVGGSGEVYLVRDAEGAQSALKRVEAHGNPKAAERLRREVSALMAVRHPAVPRVIDAELDDVETFVVFEYVLGECLADHVARNGPLQGEELASMAERVAEALEAAHAAGVIHRDVTPANVMMAPEGAVLIDFGLAQRDDDARLTREGLVSGTAGYVAPEVIDGAEPGMGADAWAWAATVAFAMTGKAPFGVGGGAIRATLKGAWKPPAIQGAETVADALASNPDLRPGMRDVVAALRGATRVLPREALARTAVMPAESVTEDDDWGQEDDAEWDGEERTIDDLVLPASGEWGPRWDPAPRRPVVLAAWSIAVAATAAVAPVLAVAVIFAAALIGRTAFRRAFSLMAARERRGPRRGDAAWHTVALPWHAGRAFAELIPSAVLAVALGAGTAALGWQLVSSGAIATLTPTGQTWGHAAALAVGLGAFEASLWWGLWSWGTREGAYVVAESLVPFRGIAVAWVVVALALASAAAVAVGLGAEPWWWPLPHMPGAR